MAKRTDAESRRANARARLIRYLKKGGSLVCEALPDGSKAWPKANRSGEVFSDSVVGKMVWRGFRMKGQRHHLAHDPEQRCFVIRDGFVER